MVLAITSSSWPPLDARCPLAISPDRWLWYHSPSHLWRPLRFSKCPALVPFFLGMQTCTFLGCAGQWESLGCQGCIFLAHSQKHEPILLTQGGSPSYSLHFFCGVWILLLRSLRDGNKLFHSWSSQLWVGALSFGLALSTGPFLHSWLHVSSAVFILTLLPPHTLRKCYSTVSELGGGWGEGVGSLALTPSCLYVLRPGLLKLKNFYPVFLLSQPFAMNPIMLKWGKTWGF